VSTEPPAPPTPLVVATRKALSINQTLPRGSHLHPPCSAGLRFPPPAGRDTIWATWLRRRAPS
jgi:hypothetical protein